MQIPNTQLYQINGIRSFLIGISIARHGDLTGQIGLIGYYPIGVNLLIFKYENAL